MKKEFDREEKLFRRVIRNPHFWKTKEGRPTSALFKDSKGVSVDRDGGRSDSSITSSFLERFGKENTKSIVYVEVAYCLDINAHLLYSPTEDNKHHAEIHDSPDTVTLHARKAKKLARNSQIVYID